MAFVVDNDRDSIRTHFRPRVLKNIVDDWGFESRVGLGVVELRMVEAIQKTLACASGTKVLDRLSFVALE